MSRKIIIAKDSFTYQDMRYLLSDSEKALVMELLKFMNEDNFVYLYQKPQCKKRIIDQIAGSLGITAGTVESMISRILKKQNELRYFFYYTGSGVKGELFVSPELAVSTEEAYDRIYQQIIPKLKFIKEKE
jgi:hypothetical protein